MLFLSVTFIPPLDINIVTSQRGIRGAIRPPGCHYAELGPQSSLTTKQPSSEGGGQLVLVPKGPGLHTQPPELVPGISHQDKGFHGQSF